MTPCFLATCRDRASLSTVTPKNIFPRHVRKFRLGRPTRSPTPGREHATGSRASPRRDRARAPHAVHRRGEARARGGPPGALSRRHASFLVVPAVRGAPIALIRGPECAGVPRVPRTPVSTVASIRAAKLRQKLGAEPGLLSPVPRKPRHWSPAYYARAVSELAAQERVIAGLLGGIVRALERRKGRLHGPR